MLPRALGENGSNRDIDAEVTTVEQDASLLWWPFSPKGRGAVSIGGVSLGMQVVLDKQYPLPGGGLEGRDFYQTQFGQVIVQVAYKIINKTQSRKLD